MATTPVNTRRIHPRTMATVARATVVVASGIALGTLSAHLNSEGFAKASSAAGAAVKADSVKPKVVTVVRKKHVASDPIIVYRQVPSTTSSGATGGTGYSSGSSGYSGGSSGGSGYSSGSSGSSGGGITSAPAPQPANNPPAATSSAS